MSSVYGRKRLEWKKGNNLYFQEELILKLIPDSQYPSMFWVEWGDGVRSETFYNISRARENSVVHTLRKLNNGMDEETYDA